MFRTLVRVTLLWLLSAAATAVTAELTFYTYHLPPYQVSDADHGLSGSTVSTLKCALDAMGVDAQFKAMPRHRAEAEFRRGNVDGLFPVRPTETLLGHGTPSQPVLLQKWYLLSLDNIPAPTDNARIGVLYGDEQHQWLEENGYARIQGVGRAKQLLRLLEYRRVDAILIDWKSAAAAMTDHGTELSGLGELENLTRDFVGFHAKHLMVHHDTRAEHDQFLQDFNRHLKPCVVTEFTLAEHEQQQISHLAGTLLSDLRESMDLREAVMPPGYYQSFTEMLIQDHLWDRRPPDRPTLLAEAVLQNPVSSELWHWHRRHNGLVTEVFLMDSLGANTAMSHITSDFWQGNERKYLEILDKTEDEVLIKPLYFDESTGRFQVMTASPVRGPDGEFLGGIALGLDVERIMIETNASDGD